MTLSHHRPPAPPPVASLSDDELLVLESTLRVQLAVAKHVQIAQVTGVIGGSVLSGGLSAITGGISIVCSHVQRRKLKHRHRDCAFEILRRGLRPYVKAEEKALGKRAYAITCATGLVCCVLSFASDLLIDEAVMQVVNEVVMNLVEEVVMGTFESHMTAQVSTAAVMASSSVAAHESKRHRLMAAVSWSELKSSVKSHIHHIPLLNHKAESMPELPDLFGERELEKQQSLVTQDDDDDVEHEVEVRRSRSYSKAYGECLVLRFSTQSRASEVNNTLDAAATSRESISYRRFGRTTIVDEHDIMTESQWTALWTHHEEQVDNHSDDDDWISLFAGHSVEEFHEDTSSTPPEYGHKDENDDWASLFGDVGSEQHVAATASTRK